MWTYAEQIRLLELHHGRESLQTMSIILKKSVDACLSRLQILKEEPSEAEFSLLESRYVSFPLLIPTSRVKHLIGKKHVRILTIEKTSGAHFYITNVEETKESIIIISAVEVRNARTILLLKMLLTWPFLSSLTDPVACPLLSFWSQSPFDCLDPNFLFNTKRSSGAQFEFTDWGENGLVIDIYGQLEEVQKAFTALALRLRKYAFKLSTLVKRIQSINAKESDLGISEEASWHAKYKNSAYVFVGSLAYDLTEGDLLAVFAQYGEVVDVTLAVDNLNGAQVLGRTIRVDHSSKYTKREEEDEETQRQKREAHGVCKAFQRGECTRGDSCKFSHDEKRAANTGWGHEEDRSSRWDHDKFNGAKKGGTSFGHIGDFKPDTEEKKYREKGHGDTSYGRPRERERERVEREPRSRDSYDRREQKRPGRLDDSQSSLLGRH